MKWLHKHVRSGLPQQGVITGVLFIDAPELFPGLNKHLSGTRTCTHAHPDALLNAVRRSRIVSWAPDLTSADSSVILFSHTIVDYLPWGACVLITPTADACQMHAAPPGKATRAVTGGVIILSAGACVCVRASIPLCVQTDVCVYTPESGSLSKLESNKLMHH